MASLARSLIKKRIRRNQYFEALKRLTNADDRTLAVIIGTLIDIGLSRIIKSKMRQPVSVHDHLFEANGALSGTTAKIKLAYALGLIGPRTKHDLETINDIRNAFAHAPTNIRFSNRRIKDRLDGLHLHKEIQAAIGTNFRVYGKSTRDAFFRCSTVYVIGLAVMKTRGPRLSPIKGYLGT